MRPIFLKNQPLFPIRESITNFRSVQDKNTQVTALWLEVRRLRIFYFLFSFFFFKFYINIWMLLSNHFGKQLIMLWWLHGLLHHKEGGTQLIIWFPMALKWWKVLVFFHRFFCKTSSNIQNIISKSCFIIAVLIEIWDGEQEHNLFQLYVNALTTSRWQEKHWKLPIRVLKRPIFC